MAEPRNRATRSPGDLLQEADEWREYVGQDVVVEIAENSHNGLSTNERRIGVEKDVEVRAKARINFLAWVNDAGERPSYFSATINYRREADGSGSRKAADVLRLQRIEGGAFKCANREVQKSVLIDPIQFMDTPQRVALVRAPTVVRLEPLDDFLSRRVHATGLEEATTRSGLPSVRTLASQAIETGAAIAPLVPEDGEFRALHDIIGERGSVRRSEFETEVVKRRSQALEHLSDEHREWLSRRRVCRDPSGVLMGAILARDLRVRFLVNGVQCGVEIPANLFTQILQVSTRAS